MRHYLGGVPKYAAGGWLPTDLASLALWLDPSDTATITHSSGAVSQINDKSGNGRHHTQGTAGSRPTTGTRTINGLNALDCDGGNDRMEFTWTAVSQPITLAAVVEFDTLSAAARAVYGRGSLTTWWAGASTASEWRMYAGTALVGGTTSTGPHLLVYTFNGASSSVRVDGSTVASGTANTGGITAALHGWGASGSNAGPIDGGLGDLTICTAALTGTDLTAMENYLSTKWGTP